VAKKGKNQGKLRTFMMRLPILEQFENLLKLAPLRQLRRTKNSGIRIIPTPVPLFGL